MVPSETTSTTACKWRMVCITNSLNKQDGYRGETRYALVERNKQDGYRGETRYALVERNCVLFYLIIVFREGSQVRFELLSEIF